MHNVHGFENNCEISFIVGVDEVVSNLPFYYIKVVQFENAWGLKDEDLYKFTDRLRVSIVFTVSKKFKKHLSEYISIFMRFGLSD